MRFLSSLALAACLAACSENSEPARPAVDAAPPADRATAPKDANAAVDSPVASTDAPAVDATTTGFSPCATPDACGWIEAYQREVVGRLSGERPITAGVTLTRRSSPTQRETARGYLRDELRALGVEADFHTYATGANVRARLPATTGADASRIVVGAHYDGVAAGPAAADDATGVAIVLVAARYLAGLPRRDHPIELVLFDQEEVGLIGSAAYVTTLRAEGAALDSAHTFDMLSFDGDGDNAIELWSPSAGLEALYRQHATPRGIPVNAVRFTSSDHQSFLTRSLPAVGVGEEFVGNDHTPHYHRATDTYDRVDFGYLARMTRLALDVLADRAVD
jgi:hypothetical protein